MAINTTYHSHFNDQIVISQDQWAVTMICNSRISILNITNRFLGNNHALLMIEGVTKANDVFVKKIHLMGEAEKKEKKENDPNKVVFKGLSGGFSRMERLGRVLIEDRTGEPLHHTHKSETWLRSSDQVQQMIDEAVREKDFPMKYPRPFSILGDKSILTVKLETFEIRDPFINMLANADKSRFEKLYKRVEACRDGDVGGIKRLKDRYFYPLKDADPNYNGRGKGNGGISIVGKTFSILWFRYIEKADLSLGNGYSVTMNAPIRIHIQKLFEACKTPKEIDRAIHRFTRYEAVRVFLKRGNRWLSAEMAEMSYAILKDFRRWSKKAIVMFPKMKNEIDAWMVDFEEDGLAACRHFMIRIYKKVTLNPPLEADSCFTWARKKLTIIDVNLEDVGIESVISATKLYIDHAGKKPHKIEDVVEDDIEDNDMIPLLEEQNLQPRVRVPVVIEPNLQPRAQPRRRAARVIEPNARPRREIPLMEAQGIRNRNRIQDSEPSILTRISKKVCLVVSCGTCNYPSREY